MTFPYPVRHLARSLTLVLLACAACGEGSSTVEPDTKPAPEAPPPKPAPAPPAEPEPVAKALPKTVADFDAAIAAAVEIHSEHRNTFYCDCSYTPQLRIGRGSCGYKTRADESLSKRVAWDRVVPNRAFGEHRACWRDPVCKDESGEAFSGVRCCQDVDEEFRAMELDLHNLVPAVGELQADRSDFDFGEIDGETRMYGACDFEVDRALQRAEPEEDTRGDIARTYLYMHETYGEGLPLTAEELARFREWHEADPPTAWEVQRNRRIAQIQGSANSYVPMVEPPAEDEVVAKVARRKGRAGTPGKAAAATSKSGPDDNAEPAPAAVDAPAAEPDGVAAAESEQPPA